MQLEAVLRKLFSRLESAFAALTTARRENEFEFDAVGARAVTGGRTYSSWISSLSEPQQRFLLQPIRHSVKLRGPAGSGKTLALELKALQLCYEAEASGDDVRVLFATHSWSVAEQVQSALDLLDERGARSQIDVFPLLSLAQLALQERGQLNVLGDDSFSGKEAQLRELSRLLDGAVASDWVAFRSVASAGFTHRVEAPRRTNEYNRLLWDLVLEFSTVIGANGILPGMNAERRYKRVERRSWMMPLESDADKEFVFLLYTRFVKSLRAQQQMSSDQVIADYLNHLSTFRWYSDRPSKGYDYILVDEYHLFNEQERMVFHHLTRDPDSYPVVFMALDPRQSPTEVYAEFSAPGEDRGGSGAVEASLGATTSVDLDRVYRYTPEILAFLKCIDRFYPTLDLGADWGVSLVEAQSTRDSGQRPQLTVHSSLEEEISGLLREAAELSDRGVRVAVLALGMESFRALLSAAAADGVRVHVIESREDVDKLQYMTRRGIVLSQPQYVAGLQFDAVLIGGIAAAQQHYAPHQSYSLRRFLSDVYLGASRARDLLRLHAHQDGGELPHVLQLAVRDGLLVASPHGERWTGGAPWRPSRD